MTGKQNIIVLLGGGLLVANVMFDQQFSSLKQGVSAGSLSASDVDSTPIKMVLIGTITLLALDAMASTSDTAANTILIILISLWILWINSYKGQQSTATTKTTTTTTTTAKGSKSGSTQT